MIIPNYSTEVPEHNFYIATQSYFLLVVNIHFFLQFYGKKKIKQNFNNETESCFILAGNLTFFLKFKGENHISYLFHIRKFQPSTSSIPQCRAQMGHTCFKVICAIRGSKLND